jgi:hypothetical protein
MPMATPTASMAKPTTTAAAIVLPTNRIRGRAGGATLSSNSSGSSVWLNEVIGVCRGTPVSMYSPPTSPSGSSSSTME